MKELSFEKMEAIQGGKISWKCALAAAGMLAALGAVTVSTAGTGLALALEALAYTLTATGFAASCMDELIDLYS